MINKLVRLEIMRLGRKRHYATGNVRNGFRVHDEEVYDTFIEGKKIGRSICVEYFRKETGIILLRGGTAKIYMEIEYDL